MEDIAPKLLEKIQKEFEAEYLKRKKIIALNKKIADGVASYKACHAFAIEVGEILAEVFGRNLSSEILPDGKLYYNIADRVIRPMLEKDFEIVSEFSRETQNLFNKNAKIGIKAIKPKMNEDKVQGIIDIVSGKDNFDDIAYMLDEPIINFSQTIVDDTVKTNADFQYKAGMSPKIRRISTGKCCEWCDKLAGIYDYEDVSGRGNDVFRRHRACRCLVEYDPGDGKRQNVHTKKWSKLNKSDRIELPKNREDRVKYENNLDFVSKIIEHPKLLSSFTPKSLKKELEKNGYNIKPLGRGFLKGKNFEDGGGYKVNFGGDGIFQYHPEEHSHHGGEYYKISKGNIRRKWYDMDGDEIDVEKTKELGKQVKKEI